MFKVVCEQKPKINPEQGINSTPDKGKEYFVTAVAKPFPSLKLEYYQIEGFPGTWGFLSVYFKKVDDGFADKVLEEIFKEELCLQET